MFKKLNKLTQGAKVRLVAPGSHFDPEQFAAGVEVLKGAGLVPTWRPDLSEKAGYLAGSDVRRREELHEAFADKTIEAIFCVRGGFGTTRILPHLNRKLISTNPKPLIGFSDVTALLCMLAQECKMASVHGPLVAGGFQTPDAPETLDLLLQLLRSSQPYAIPLDGEALCGGVAAGILMGGNLTVLHCLLGLPSFPKLKGALLFLEEVNEKPYRIDRMLCHMSQLATFQGVAGVIVGNLGTGDRLWEREIAQEYFGKLGVPLLTGVSIGHPIPRWPLPVGVHASLDATTLRLHCEPLVS